MSKHYQGLKQISTRLGLILCCMSKAVKQPSFWLELMSNVVYESLGNAPIGLCLY